MRTILLLDPPCLQYIKVVLGTVARLAAIQMVSKVLVMVGIAKG